MDPRFSLKEYPRKDKVYQIKSSYNFETIYSRVYLKREKKGLEELYRWLIHSLIGFFVGSIAFLMGYAEEHVAEIHAHYTQELLHNRSIGVAYSFFFGWPLIFALIGVLLTVYYGPYAAGSGVPEVMGMLNGVQGGGATYIATLITKALGTTLAVMANLCVGKEGPLVHIGAICGCVVPYIPFKSFEPFRNDSDKRTFMAAGCSAGVAAAFGAPIGGTLFTYEISKPNTFWTFSMLWRVFFTAAIAVFTLGILQQLETGALLSLSNSAALKFGNVDIIYSPLSDAAVAIFIGIICGVLGAGFIAIYTYLGILRKKHINTNFKKIVEVLFFSFATSSTFFWLSAWSAYN